MKEKSVYFVCLALLISVIFSVEASESFNMTEELEQETRVLELCIVGIELDECKYIYGGGSGDGKID